MHGRCRGRQAGIVAVNPVGSAAPPGQPAAESGRSWPAAAALFFGAGLIPESVLTFNTPPLRLLTSPASLLFISAFYGSVALLVREFWRRTSAPPAAILLLGMAAGAVNEGIIAGTWYRVQYPGYALIGGLDPAAAAGLTVFHALASTIVPILLVELAFPRIAARPWLPRPARAGCWLLLAATAATGFAAAGHRGQKLAVLAAVVLAAVIARACARPGRLAGTRGTAAPKAAARPVPGLTRLRLAGAAATVAFYVIFAVAAGLLAAIVPQRGLPAGQFLLVGLTAGYFAAVMRISRNWTRRPGWGPAQTLAVLTGVLLPAILASLVLPAALRALEPLVTLPALGLLIWLRWRQRAGPLLRE